MTVTLNDLIAEVESFTYSYFNDRDKVTSLAQDMSSSALVFYADESEQIDRGFVEIDSELIAVKARSTTDSAVEVFGWGRGQRGTTAAAHTAGTKVTVNPRFPRSWIKTEINTAILNMYPDLFAVATDTSNTFTPSVMVYPLPAAAEGILHVNVDTIGPSKLWMPTRRWRFDYSAATSEFPTGKTLTLLQGFTPGQTIQVVYRKQFSELVADSDTLASIGMDDSWRDLIKLHVAAKMIMALDSSRLQTVSVEASNRNNQVQPGMAAQVARQLMQMFAMRLEQERRLLLNRYPGVQQLR